MDNALLLDTSVVSIFLKSSSVHATRLQKIQQELTNKVVEPHDLWIASAALEFDIPILTSDNDFDRIPDVSVITS